MTSYDGVTYELLPNGVIRGRDQASGLVGTWNPNGTSRRGDLSRVRGIPAEVLRRLGVDLD